MGKFVGISVGLFVLAVLFIGLTQGSETTAIFAAFGALPWLQKIAWAVIVLVPLIMLPFGVWLWDRLVRQQQSGTPAGLANRIDPDELNELDRYILKEAFKQAKKLQMRLQLEYRL